MRHDSWVELTKAYAEEELKGLVDDVTVESESPRLHPDQCEIITTYMKGEVRRYCAQVVTRKLMSSLDERKDWMEFFKSVIRHDKERVAGVMVNDQR